MTTLGDRYELQAQVGEGGMGVVWRAFDRKLERDVAIKLLHSFIANDREQRRRFNREARTLAGLANEHIVRVYDYVEDGEQSFLVMEYVAGPSLAEATLEKLPLPPGVAAWYAKPVAEALAYAHPRGVIHRDLTPANILVEQATGRVVTTDYGLARIARSAGSLTATGVLIGTPEYWSPEQAMGRESDSSSDMYALGCILFLLLSGRLVFGGGDRLAIGLRRAHEDAPSLREVKPDAPGRAVALVDSLLSRDPAGRPTAAEAAAALAEIAPLRMPPRFDSAVRTAIEPATILLSRDAPTLLEQADAYCAEPPTLLNARVAPALERPSAADAPLPPQAVAPPPRRRRKRRTAAAALAAGIAAAAGVITAHELGTPDARAAPNVVAMREAVARARLLDALPDASVLAVRVYSTHVAAGRVIRQRPLPRTKLGAGDDVTLTVSKGSPYAAIPAIRTGIPAATAMASLTRRGFTGRYRFMPSWSVRKGSVIELRPRAGARLRRPATVKILVASGYPRSVVPDVGNVSLGAAQAQLSAKHLRYHVVYQLTHDAPAGTVIRQMPAARATVYRGTRVRLTVARTLGWQTVFARSGADSYESNWFVVPARWRIRYRLTSPSDGFAPALAQLGWVKDGSLFGSRLLADRADTLITYDVQDGAGTYRLSVNPYAATSWYVEVDAWK
jgi:serine/threonine-protein kinase